MTKKKGCSKGPKEKVVKVHVYRGVVTDVTCLPRGYRYKIIDRD